LSKVVEPYRSVVARALEKDPARRFATVGEMLAALPMATAIPVGSQRQAGKPDLPLFPPADPPATAGAAHDESVDQEPIARFVARQLAKVRQYWQQPNVPLWCKVLVATIGILLFLVTAHVVLSLAMLLLIMYGVYRAVRFVHRACFRPAGVARPAAAAVLRPTAVSQAPVPAIVKPPLAVRVTDLIGSLLVSAGVTAAMCVVMLVIAAYRGVPLQIEQCAWLYLVSLAGAWCVLAAAKFWESARGERMLRHFILMTVGFAWGLLAFGVAEGFLVRLPEDHDFSNKAPAQWVPTAFYHDGRPTAMAFVAVCATLLAVLRWWLDADPMRGTRLSLWSLLVTVVFANIIATAWQFPQPWLMMVAGCMSVTVQLFSPWVPTYARLRAQRKTKL
jgi:hypothetical protein